MSKANKNLHKFHSVTNFIQFNMRKILIQCILESNMTVNKFEGENYY